MSATGTDTQRSTYTLDDGIATITMDDGKVNALSSAMLAELDAHLDRAEQDQAVVLLTGRATTFSAGFDLKTDAEGWPPMLIAGASLAKRILAHPFPVIAANPGNAVAMGAFLLCAPDVRIGADGPFRIGLNEVAIGLTVPYWGIALAEHRLQRPYLDRATITGELFEPHEARTAGFLDHVVAPDTLLDRAREIAQQLKGLNMQAHAATKRRIRAQAIANVEAGIERIRTKELPEW